MKFILFSPFAKASAIGRVTALIVKAMLDRGDSVVVVRTEHESLLNMPAHASDAALIPWTDDGAVRAAVDDADALVYQIGNNYSYHRGGLHWLPLLPGIVCLHDFLVAHLFAEWAHDRREEAERVLAGWYGADAATAFFKADTSKAFIDMASQLYPMTEWIASMALCVVSHSHWGMPRVAQACAGPLRVVPLPYDAPFCTSDAPGTSDENRKDGLVNVLTVGHVNPNKRIDSVIRAIGSSAHLRQAVSYRLCGLIEPRVAVELTSLARAQGVNLEISGETDDRVLQSAMNEADVVCCLRWPSFESASATTIEALLYGKAVVVTNAAFYSEIPGDIVRKISPDDEVAELRATLEELLSNPESRLSMAERGRTWAEQTFNADRYVEELASLATAAAAAQPALDMAATLIEYLQGWYASLEIMTSAHLSNPLAIFEDLTKSAATERPLSSEPRTTARGDTVQQKHTT